VVAVGEERACLHWAGLACFSGLTVRPASSQPPLFTFATKHA
jgi:hypothetical protein